MANLNLTHSGNMNINSASINSQGQIEVDYAPNTTGKVTGWTTNPEGVDGTYEPGESLTVRFTPQFSGTVLTETFTVSGVDVAGVQRSDSATLRQDYNKDLRTYNIYVYERECTVNSSSVTENYVEFNITMPSVTAQTYADLIVGVNGGSSTYWGAYVVPPTPGPDTGSTTASTLNIVVADSITGTGRASAVYTPSSATVSLRYQSGSPAYATIDPLTGEITVLQTGDVRFFVFDDVTGLFDSKVVHCYKDGDEPIDTGTVIDSLSIVVGAQIIGSGYVSSIYTPENAEVDLHYTSNLPSVASVDETTGLVTVHSTGNVTFCVRDTKSGLSDCRAVNVLTPEPGIIPATALTINVADTITDSGVATATYEPANADVSLYYSYEDTDIIGANRAGIDRYTGQISVRSTGTARFCVEDQQTGLKDCKVVNVIKSDTPDTGDTGSGGTLEITYTNLVSGVDYQYVNTSIGGYVPWNWYGDRPTETTSDYLIGYTEYGDIIAISPRTTRFNGTGDLTVRFPNVKNIPGWAFDRQYDSSGSYNDYHLPQIKSIKIGDGINYVGEDAFAWHSDDMKDCDLIIPETTIVDELSFIGSDFNSLTIEGPFHTGKILSDEKVRYNSFGCYQGYPVGYPVYVDIEYVNDYKSINNSCCWPNWVGGITTSLRINMDSTIIDQGAIGVVYDSGATVDLTYSCSDSTLATVDSSGIITVLEGGVVEVCVYDSVSKLSDCKTIIVEKTSEPTYKDQYFTIEALSSGNISITTGYRSTPIVSPYSLTYSKDSGSTWDTASTVVNNSKITSTINVNSGDIVYLQGYHYYADGVGISATCSFNVSGNIRSLWSRDFATENQTTVPLAYAFSGCTGLVNAENLVLPDILTNSNVNYQNFEYMFYQCSNLRTAPKKLGALTLYTNCYEAMFMECTSLVTAPELPALTMAERCYMDMFTNCTSLTTAPELPATTLAEYCYSGMFLYCSSLTTAPELPALSLPEMCYINMFYECAALSLIKCLGTSIGDRAVQNWVSGVASSGTFVKNPSMSSWPTGVSGIPSGWTVENAT